jgi:hypothetical protein
MSPVSLEHEDGVPTGKASIEYNAPNQTKRAVRLLANATLSSIPLNVTGFEHAIHPKYSRGQKVDEEYVNETLSEKAPATVVIFGFPAKWGLRETRTFLHDYRLDTWGEPVEAFKKIFACVFIYWVFNAIIDDCGRRGNSSRWVVHLSNMEDAHRLVRHLHMNRFALGHRTDTLLGARILYS